MALKVSLIAGLSAYSNLDYLRDTKFKGLCGGHPLCGVALLALDAAGTFAGPGRSGWSTHHLRRNRSARRREVGLLHLSASRMLSIAQNRIFKEN